MRPAAWLAAVMALGLAGVSACAAPTTMLEPALHAGHHPAAAVAPAAPLRAGERFLELRMAHPYVPVPPNGGTDEYRCFLVDPRLTEPTFVTGSQFLPQNAAVVHHAIIFRVDPGDVPRARTLDESDAGDGWTCFGGTGIRGPGAQLSVGGGWIGAWAPGAPEGLIGANTGYRLAAHSQIILQIHYNLLATGGRATADQSGIRLRLTAGTAKLVALKTTLLPAPVELPCTPAESGPLCERTTAVADVARRFGSQAIATVGALAYLCTSNHQPTAGSTQHCDQKVRQAGLVYAVAGHMHLLGRAIRVELNPGTSHARTLLDVPLYNFDDQGARTLSKPVRIQPGDTLRVTCTHDAGLRAKLPELRPLPPRYVVWGDGTSDEMCLGIVIWAPAS